MHTTSDINQSVATTDQFKVHFNLSELIFGKIINSTISNIRSDTHDVEPQKFLKTALFSAGYMIIELLLYIILRNIFQKVYQPRRFLGISEHRCNIWNAIFGDEESIQRMADTDAYYFIRFLNFICFYFLVVSIINLPILLPVHYYYNSGHKFTMNSLSMINVKEELMFIHLMLCYINVLVFHLLLLRECKKAILCAKGTLRESFQRVVYVSNITECLENFKYLLKTDHQIKEVCQLPIDSHITYTKWKTAYTLEQQIEKIILDIVTETYYMNNTVLLFKDKLDFSTILINIFHYLNFKRRRMNFLCKTIGCRLRGICTREWYRDALMLAQEGELTRQTKFQVMRYASLNRKLKDYRGVLDSLRSKPLAIQIGRFGHWSVEKDCLDKGLLEFHTSANAFTMSLMFNKSTPNICTRTVLGPNPADIIRLTMVYSNKYISYTLVLITGIVSVSIIVGWVIPIASIGFVAYIPYITVTHIQPLFLYLFRSDIAKEFATTVFPFVTLIFLTEFVPFIFRFLAFLKGFPTHAEVEQNVQFWFFLFLYIHLFVVLTTSSGISFVVHGLINNPNGIPIILARELPKSGIFFCSFIFLRCMSYFGGNCLRIIDLIKFIFQRVSRTYTPHSTIDQMKNLLRFQWGSIYALFSVLGCIGITYSILCPIILPISSFSFFMVGISFRHLFESQYIADNISNTRGKLYQETFSQLYAGIYFMEFSLLGIFMLSDQYTFGFWTAVIFILSIASHVHIKKYIKCLDLESVMNVDSGKESGDFLNDDVSQLNWFKIPSFKKIQAYGEIWVPTDPVGSIKTDIQYIRDRYDIVINDEMCKFDEYGGIHLL